jgi:D-3-phosphoglycerate dehydrogenase
VRIGILEADGFSMVAQKQLAVLGEVDAFTGGDLPSFLADKDALFVRLAHRIDGQFLEIAPRIRVLCSPTTGLTHIDLDALYQRGVTLLSLKGETLFLEEIRATPEHAIGLLISLLRRYRTAFLDSENSHWDRDRCRGEELCNMPVGIIGFGRVGRHLANYLSAFGAHVGWYDPHIPDVLTDARRYHRLPELIAQNRAIVLAASYESGKPPILDVCAVAALSGKYFVNIARGELVDEEALLAAIERDELAGCAIDVIANEHLVDNRKRWIAATRANNVIVTPHIAGATFTSMRKTEEFLADKLAAFLGYTAASRRPLQVQ